MSTEFDLGQLLDSICRLRRAAVGDQRYTAYRVAALERALVIMEEKLQYQEQKIQYLENELRVNMCGREHQIANGAELLVDTTESSFQLNVGPGFEVNVQCRMDSSVFQLPVTNTEASVDSMLMIDAPPATPIQQHNDLLAHDGDANLDSFLEDIKTPVLEPEKHA